MSSRYVAVVGPSGDPGAAVLALAPVLNIVVLSIARNIGHERYLTFPLVLFVLSLALAPAPAHAASRAPTREAPATSRAAIASSGDTGSR